MNYSDIKQRVHDIVYDSDKDGYTIPQAQDLICTELTTLAQTTYLDGMAFERLNGLKELYPTLENIVNTPWIGHNEDMIRLKALLFDTRLEIEQLEKRKGL